MARRERRVSSSPGGHPSHLNVQYIDGLYTEEKVCPQRVRWRQVGPKWTFEVTIFGVSSGQKMTYRGWYLRTKMGARFGFSITVFRNVLVRRYCPSEHHKEMHGKRHWIRTPHKHRFVDFDNPQAAYAIPPGEIHLTDVNQAFDDFCKECNIKLNAAYEQILPGML